MSTARFHPQHPLPAPVVHQAFSVPQSKSHVLAGVQDAYWSDDENEDAECPLCLEEMDISDLNFKPCVCGYQICRFCWHHIKENLNKRCPACRRVYTDDAIEFKPIATQDHKRLTQQKKQRERERKDLEALGRRQLANVRVVQRNVVYIVGIGPRFAKEELIPTLRSNEYFGQYGKITKILLVKRNQPGGSAPVVGLYITYHRREDAARAIAAVDGTPSPGGSRDVVMRASYGTTKYCMAFLRGVPCNDHSCMNLHEWGDEKDCFTKEDLTTLKHTMKATESRARTTTTTAKKGDEDAGLPRAASWAQKLPVGQSVNGPGSTSSSITVPMSSLPVGRQHRRGAASTRQIRTTNGATTSSGTESRVSQAKPSSDRKGTPISRPETPATAEPARDAQPEPKTKVKEPPSLPSSSPAPSVTTSSEVGSAVAETAPLPAEPLEINEPSPPPPAAPSPVPQVPPGLSAPPGIPTPSRPPRAETASPQTPLLASQSSYQMSTAARALLDDVKARRESILSSSTSLSSPFPDFDRTLQTLTAGDGGGFSFNFDPKLVDESTADEPLPTFDMEAMTPFKGSYVEAFPALRAPFVSGNGTTTPGSSIYDPNAQPPAKPSSYMGSFNPFGPSADDRLSSGNTSLKGQYPSLDEERKVSRFGFARHRPNIGGSPSPHPMSSLHSDPHHHSPMDEHHLHQWNSNLGAHLPDSRLLPNALNQSQVHPISLLSQHQAISAELSEAQLRNFIQSNQGDLNIRGFNNAGHSMFPTQHFEDPAIMSASFIPSNNEPQQQYFPPVAYGPPPGLPVPQSLASAHQSPIPQQHGVAEDTHQSVPSRPTSSASPLPTLSSPEEFPALVSNEPSPVNAPSDRPSIPLPALSTAQNKAERKAAKKAAAAEKALERQKAAQEKAEARAKQKEKEKEEKEKEKAKNAEAMQDKKKKSVPAEAPILAAIPSASSASTSSKPSQEPVSGNKTVPITESKAPVKKASTNKLKPSDTKAPPLPVPAKPTKKPPLPPTPTAASSVPAPSVQVPLLSKKPKKVKPITKTTKNIKDEELADDVVPSSVADGGLTADSSSVNSRAQSVDRQESPRSVVELLQDIDRVCPGIDLAHNPFFDLQRFGSPAKMPLEYGPLVHALSALSVGGGSFTNSMPSGSIDNAVSSFQQLLETLTQTISDLLRLLPRTTWDDSSSFDGVLRDMLKGDDFLDDGGEDGPSREDEVAALTLALERRARWMEVQLSKLEELHRDINTAAVRAVLSFNDNGWDKHQFLPVVGNTLNRFDAIGIVEENGTVRHMTADELEKKLAVAKEAAVFAETEIREAMEKFQAAQFLNDDV